MAILIFFVIHWYASLFTQTFFLHRYAAHQMFTLSPGKIKFWYIMTFLTQGSSALSVRAYAILHRMHHEFSDTEKDPHSPHFFRSIVSMMLHTKKVYHSILAGTFSPGPEFEKDVPHWEAMERFYDFWLVRVSWGVLYTLFYIAFATHWWMYLLLPVHYLMGPVHGAIVNWAGHKYGYRNHNLPDESKNSIPFDFLLLGELFQNNHHANPNSVKFTSRWWEIDFGYLLMSLLSKFGLMRIRKG
ncbi:MAG: acyl-CoA desaturase [Calditrichia bacterium]